MIRLLQNTDLLFIVPIFPVSDFFFDLEMEKLKQHPSKKGFTGVYLNCKEPAERSR